jgi:hypothetical protein
LVLFSSSIEPGIALPLGSVGDSLLVRVAIEGGFVSPGSVHGPIDIACGAGVRDHFTGVSKDDRFGGNVEVDVRTWGNKGFGSYGHFANNNCVRADPDAIFKHWCACALPSALGADKGLGTSIYLGFRHTTEFFNKFLVRVGCLKRVSAARRSRPNLASRMLLKMIAIVFSWDENLDVPSLGSGGKT